MYREQTRNFLVEVEPQFLPERSSAQAGYFYFSYRVRITNQGESPAKLLSRHWIITDGHGEVQEVRGDGVVGQQPRIEPGQSFEYTSFCPLPTPTGNMRGSYLLVEDSGTEFSARIPLFFLRDLAHLH